MQKLSRLINQKQPSDPAGERMGGLVSGPPALDEKTIFYVFQTLVRREYGARGSVALTPQRYHEHILFVSAGNALWAHEFTSQADRFLALLNDELGREAVRGVRVKHRYAG